MVSNQRQFDQPLFRRPQFHAPVLGGWTFVIERWVTQPSDAVADVLRDHSIIAAPDGFALGDDGTLLVDEAPRRSSFATAPGFEMWRATAQLLSGRRRLLARLDVEIAIRAPDSVLIQLRPLHRRPQRWSARRARRYFALAHAAADRLEQLFKEHALVDLRTETARQDLGALTTWPIDSAPASTDSTRAPLGSRPRLGTWAPPS